MKKIIFLFLLINSSLFSQVLINEYSAANYDDIDFLAGPETNYSDWVELYNPGTSSVNLSGYYLSDRISNIQKWQIPVGANIPAGGYLVFLADKQDGFSGGYYHTNFKLTQTSFNEILIFSDPSGIIIDSISLNYPNKKNDSRCRITDGSATWAISKNPTEGSTNNNSKDRYALTPIFDTNAGFYSSSITLSLSTTEASSEIRYTLDGSKPNSSSTLYSSPVSISSTTVVRAKTYSSNPNISSSHIETNTYFINENHTTKVVSISGGSGLDNLLGGSFLEPEGTFELFETDGSFLTESTGEFNKHGNDSWAYDQRGVDYISRDQFGKNHSLEDEIFDNKSRNKFQRIILKCGASDNYPFEGAANSNYLGEYGGAHIRDAYIHEMSQLGDLRLDERSTEFAVLYVNGNYWGVYDIREKADDHDFTRYYYDQDKNDLQYLKTWGGTWSEYGGVAAQTDWDNLVNFITTNSMTIPANYNYVDSIYNTGSLIDYFILNGYVVNADWLNWNTAWWRGMNPSGDKKKWRYVLWDMDATFNHYTNYSGVPDQSANSDPCTPEVLGDLGGQGHVPIWNALLTNDDFFADYINRYAELSSTVFSCDSMHNLLTLMTNEIIGEMPRHITRWGGTMAEWQANIDSIHAFIDTRCVNIDSLLVDCNPEISGPYELTIIVQPPGAGEVQLSSITPSSYPYTGTYFGGVNIPLDADAFNCWEFDYWTIANDTILPNDTTENIFFTMSQDDTITVYFTPVYCGVDNTIYVDVQPTGAGTINIDGTNILSFPSTQLLNDSTNHTFDAIANAGFSFNHWDWNIHSPAPSSTSTNTIVYTYSNDTVTAYFDIILIDTVVYIVNPVGAGNITVDGTNISVFPNTSYYINASNSSLQANANTGFGFNNWEFLNNTALPNNTSTNITTTWNFSDTVIIHFDPIVSYDITYLVNPIGSGSINIDGTNTSIFPTTINYVSGTNVSLNAINNTGYSFDFWQTDLSTLLPNIATNNVNFNVVANDTIIANFGEFTTDTLWVVSNPIGVATLEVGNDIITTSPFMGIYPLGELLYINTIPNGSNVFNQWNVSSVGIPDYNENTYFTFLGQDTLYAYFNNVLSIENIGDDFSSINIFPTIVNDKITIEIKSSEKTNFNLELFDLNGKLIMEMYKGKIRNNKTFKKEFHIHDISKGIYFIKINSKKTNTSFKILKL